MKRPILAVALVLWIVAASLLLTRFWLIHHEMFPEFPRPIADYLVLLYGAQNAEEVGDLEILIGLSMSVPIVSAFTFLVCIIWRKMR
jgi:hypothetical protein